MPVVMKPRAYIETTIVSYVTARPSRDLVRVPTICTSLELVEE